MGFDDQFRTIEQGVTVRVPDGCRFVSRGKVHAGDKIVHGGGGWYHWQDVIEPQVGVSVKVFSAVARKIRLRLPTEDEIERIGEWIDGTKYRMAHCIAELELPCDPDAVEKIMFDQGWDYCGTCGKWGTRDGWDFAENGECFDCYDPDEDEDEEDSPDEEE